MVFKILVMTQYQSVSAYTYNIGILPSPSDKFKDRKVDRAYNKHVTVLL